MRLGLGSYTYGWSSGTYGSHLSQEANFSYLTAYDLIDRAVAAGLTVVQLCVKPDLGAMTQAELKAIAQYAAEKTIALEIGTIGSEPQSLLDFLRIAELLGASLVRTIFTEASDHLGREQEHIQAIADLYAEKQIVLAIENHEASSYLDLLALCEEIGSDYVGVCLDTVNSLGRGEGVGEVTKALMPFTKCLHIKDFNVRRHSSDMELTITGVLPGTGQLDIPAQLEQLYQYEPQASVILEQWVPWQDDLVATVQLQDRWAEAGIAYLKRCLKKLES